MKNALNMLRVLGHPVRLSILCNLIENGEMTAGEIVAREKAYASQSQTSQYLKKLRDEKIISARKEGQYVYYTLASPEIKTLIKTLHRLYCQE